MVYLDLIFNLSLLVALSVVSGFLDKRFSRETRTGALLQGTLFGAAAVVGMLRPLNLGPGLIFDGRSVMVSLCALFFGPWAALVAFALPAASRILMGGMGALTGVLVALSSAGIGLAAYFHRKQQSDSLSISYLYLFGIIVHLAMLSLMFTLPEGKGLSVVRQIGLPIILLYPLATILSGKILVDQLFTIRAADVIRESEERYRSLFEESLDAIILGSPDGRIFKANFAACRLFERTEEEFRRQGRNAIRDPEDRRWTAFLEERNQTGKFQGELTFLRKNGSTFSGEISTTIFRDRKGELRISAIIRDITERKQWEESLKDAELKFRTIFNSASDGILAAGVSDRKFAIANRRICDMLGYTEQELLHLSVSDIHPPEALTDLMEVFRRSSVGDVTQTKDIPMKRKDGAVFFAQISPSPITLNGVPYLLGLFRDMTERRQAEEAMQESEELFRSLFRHHAAVKLIVDSETGQIADANDAASEFYGWSHERLLQMKITDINTLPAQDVKKAMATVLSEKRTRFEFQHRLADGSLRDVEVFSSKIKPGGKNLLHSIVIDITDRKQAEEEILRLNDELEQKVNERTAELKDIIARLEETNKIFVGRELKMAELKKRIEELERK